MKVMRRSAKLMQVALLGSLGGVLMLLQIPYPGFPAFQFDISVVPVLIGGFALGPLAGIAVLAIKSIIFLLIKFTPNELIGIPMSIIAQGVFVLASTSIYRRRKTMQNAILALFSGIVTATLTMIPVNYYVLPFFTKWFLPNVPIPSSERIVEIIIFFGIPFNILNGLANAVITFFVYKRVSKVLKNKYEFIDENNPPEELLSDKQSGYTA